MEAKFLTPFPETPEKINDKLNKVLQEFRTTIEDLLGRLNISRDDVELEESIVNATYQVVISMNIYGKRWRCKLRNKICQFIDERPAILDILCKVCQSSVKNEIIKLSLRLLTQFTTYFNGIGDKICNIPGYLQFLKNTLDEKTFPSMVLSLVYNLVSATDTHVSRLQELGFTSSLKHYLSTTDESNQLHALLIIANIMKDDESDIIAANDSVVEYMLSMFNKTIKSSSYVTTDSNGTTWTISVFSRGIGKLALNDGNKKLLVDKGCLPLLRTYLIITDDVDEQIEALKCIWTLAFDEDNQTRMIEEPKLMDCIVILKKSESSRIAHVCEGILWTMRTKLAASLNFKDIGKCVIKDSNASPDPATSICTQPLAVSELSRTSTGHVMISYQWDHQIIAKQMRDKIKKQHDVWLDIDKMAGSISDAMAKAVQDSDIFIMCISRKYQNSPSCRAEAIYAAKLQKTIIPVMLEKDFKPDGWLGITLSDMLYHSFTDQQMFDANINSLLKEIQQNIQSGDEFETTTDTIDGQETITVPISKTQKTINTADLKERRNTLKRSLDYFPVKTWSSKQIQEWMSENGVSGDNIDRLTGKQIAFLQKLRVCTPEYTHYQQTIEKYLKFKSLEEMANFEEAMDNLP